MVRSGPDRGRRSPGDCRQRHSWPPWREELTRNLQVRGLTPSDDTEIISRLEMPMNSPAKVLMQTTIPPTADDWSIARFSQLRAYLADLRDELGSALFEVTARDRAPLGVPDPILANLGELDFDSLWLFAVDTGDGLTREDCAGITRFRKRGGGVLLTRDHMDLGSSLCSLGGLGDAHHFHSKNIDPDVSRQMNDDPYTTSILWPNFHSGANGDFQQITVVEPLHPVLTDPDAPGGRIQFLPAHPHEGRMWMRRRGGIRHRRESSPRGKAKLPDASLISLWPLRHRLKADVLLLSRPSIILPTTTGTHLSANPASSRRHLATPWRIHQRRNGPSGNTPPMLPCGSRIGPLMPNAHIKTLSSMRH